MIEFLSTAGWSRPWGVALPLLVVTIAGCQQPSEPADTRRPAHAVLLPASPPSGLSTFPVARDSDVEYGTADGRSLRLSVHYPFPAKKHPRPVILYLSAAEGGDLSPLSSEFVSRGGYVVVSADYRTAGEPVSPSSLPECRLAIEWLKTHADRYSIDAQRIGVWVSAGGEHRLCTLASVSDNGLVSEVVLKEGTDNRWLSEAKAYFDRQLPDPNAAGERAADR